MADDFDDDYDDGDNVPRGLSSANGRELTIKTIAFRMAHDVIDAVKYETIGRRLEVLRTAEKYIAAAAVLVENECEISGLQANDIEQIIREEAERMLKNRGKSR